MTPRERTLLAILSTARDNELVARHWHSFKATGFTIIGCGSEDGQCVWPEPVLQLNTGKLGRKQMPCGDVIWGLVKQELDIWKWFLEHKQFDSVCVVEADNYFVRQPPLHPGSGLYLVTALPNYSAPGMFKTPVYFSSPRWADRQCATQLYRHGLEMYRAGDHEQFVSDRFPAWICHKHKIPWIAQPGWSPSAFHWGVETEMDAWRRDAVAAIKAGVWVLHSVKHQWQLDLIKNATL